MIIQPLHQTGHATDGPSGFSAAPAWAGVRALASGANPAAAGETRSDASPSGKTMQGWAGCDFLHPFLTA
jgi:hypothetical protein